MVQKLNFSFLRHISLCGEASKTYKLIIIEYTSTFICIMANITYPDYITLLYYIPYL